MVKQVSLTKKGWVLNHGDYETGQWLDLHAKSWEQKCANDMDQSQFCLQIHPPQTSVP
jgi:hypothetical protein